MLELQRVSEDGHGVCSLSAADPAMSCEECRWAYYQQAFPVRAIAGTARLPLSKMWVQRRACC
eukprot:6065055-Alexandrium_andersonii.AAC.1